MKRSYFRRSRPEPDSRRDLEQKLDALTRKIVLRNETVCFTCGEEGRDSDPLQCSHIFTRTWRPTRWDVHEAGNNHAQHKSENDRHEYAPDAYNDEFVRRFGQEAFDDLDVRAHSPGKFMIIELHDMIREREEMLNGNASTEAREV